MRIIKNTIPVIGLAAALAMPGTVAAQDVENRFNVYVGGMRYLFDHDKSQQNDYGLYYGLEIPVPSQSRWSLSLEQWEVDSKFKDQTDESFVKWMRAGGNYHLNQVKGWQPYLSAGIGHLKVNPRGIPGHDKETAFDVGFGVKRYIGDRFLIRGDIKTLHGRQSSDWDVAMGLSFGLAFGSSSRPVAAAPTPPPEPAPDPDSDGDGVPDSRDRCPNTPRNLVVDEDGCPIMETTEVRQDLLVNFDFDRSEIKPEFEAPIRTFAEFMRTYGNTNAVIEGHTDSTGPEEYNQGLSERRANAVVNALIEQGIPASRLSSVGYGESRPVAPNDTPANRARNRRIEAEITVEIEQEVRR